MAEALASMAVDGQLMGSHFQVGVNVGAFLRGRATCMSSIRKFYGHTYTYNILSIYIYTPTRVSPVAFLGVWRLSSRRALAATS